MSHTTGEWIVNGDQIEVESAHNDGYRICDVFGPDYKANGLLIAASPDLLAACKLMVEWHGKRDNNEILMSPSEQEEEVRKAMEAIAKAEGRS